VTAKPAKSSVTALLTRRGWQPSEFRDDDGFTVSTLERGVICVEYDPGVLSVDPAAALAAMAEALSAEGWMVSENGRRVLVSGGNQ
jgi:hypothetical protein